MGQIHKVQATKKAARTRIQTVTKHEAPMNLGDRARMIATAARFRAGRGDFDVDYEEEDWLESEAEIAKLLGDFSGRLGNA